jgi:DNA-binding CsgD family transcriptional regulator
MKKRNKITDKQLKLAHSLLLRKLKCTFPNIKDFDELESAANYGITIAVREYKESPSSLSFNNWCLFAGYRNSLTQLQHMMFRKRVVKVIPLSRVEKEMKADELPYRMRMLAEFVPSSLPPAISWMEFENIWLNEDYEWEIEIPKIGRWEEDFSRTFFARLAHRCSHFERQVFWLVSQGCRYDEIGKQLNVDFKSVDNSMQRLRGKATILKQEMSAYANRHSNHNPT